MEGRGLPKGLFVAMLLLGTAGAIAVFVCLFILEFKLIDLAYYLPALAASALLIFGGAAKLKRK